MCDAALCATSNPDLVHHSRLYALLNEAEFTLVDSYVPLKGRTATKALIVTTTQEVRRPPLRCALSCC